MDATWTPGVGAPAATDMCEPFLEMLPVDGVSISVFDEVGQQSSIGSTGSVAAKLDELQFELGEGPQRKAVAIGEPVLIPDVMHDSHAEWPIFGAAVRQLQVGALFAIPMTMGAATIGVVSLNRATSGGLTEREISTARSMAAAAAAPAVHYAMRTASSEDGAETAIAPAMRREVHQATGMLTVQLNVSATVAFVRLQAHAFSTEQNIQQVASDVVARRLYFGDSPPPTGTSRTGRDI